MIAFLRCWFHRGRHRRRDIPIHPWLARHFVEQPSGPTSHAF